ncbi:hypothetical protein C8F01DRAFT_1266388 [Mycena amicta]|nr:hypothetical protein C8F01DRAFT_1266388 [Mycena amicta]
MDSAPVFQWVYLVKWSGYPLNASTWEPASSFDPPYEEMTAFWIAARVAGRDWMNMREFRNGDRVFLDADPAYAPGVHNFHRYNIQQMDRTPDGLAVPKDLLEDIGAETALVAKYLLDVDDGSRAEAMGKRMNLIGSLISSMVQRAEARQ